MGARVRARAAGPSTYPSTFPEALVFDSVRRLGPDGPASFRLSIGTAGPWSLLDAYTAVHVLLAALLLADLYGIATEPIRPRRGTVVALLVALGVVAALEMPVSSMRAHLGSLAEARARAFPRVQEGIELERQGRFDEALRKYHHAIEGTSGLTAAIERRASLIATDDEASRAEIAVARMDAQRLRSLERRRDDPRTHEILAAACAREGRLTAAVSWQRTAIDRVQRRDPDDPRLPCMQERLAAYRERRAWSDRAFPGYSRADPAAR